MAALPIQPFIIPRRSSTNSTLSNQSSINDFPFLDPNEWVFNCIYPDCDQTFRLTNSLYDHIRAHSSELICPICETKFKCMASLVYHVRTHSGIKPYCCPLPICPFVTATKGNLKAHLLSNQHKDAMSLDLLNIILSMDTNHGRPEVVLHAPRERKKKRKTPEFSDKLALQFVQPPRKKNRLDSYGSNQSLYSLEDETHDSQQHLHLVPLQIGAPPQYGYAQAAQHMYYSPLSPVSPMGQTHTYYDNAAIRSPATSLTHQWQNFDFLSSPQNPAEVLKMEEVDEDLTVRVNMAQLKAFEGAESFRDINQFTETDKFSMALDGSDDTKEYYGAKFHNSVFNISTSDSNSMRMSRRTSMDDLDFDLIPPLDF
eukprot:57014_1